MQVVIDTMRGGTVVALTDKVALISGAARGQGRAHAVRLAQDGANIIGLDVLGDIATVPYPLATAADLDETARQVKALGRRFEAYQADVRDTTAVERAVSDGVAKLGRLDIALANAGIGGYSPAEVMTDEQWNNMIDVNLTGVFKLVRAAIPHIKAGGRGGSIILTSSSVASRLHANVSHYAAAKWGVNGLMKALAVELAPFDIRVNSVQPSAVDTMLIQNQANYDLFRPELTNPARADASAAFRGLHLLDIDWMQPADVSNAIAFLVSDDARYLTGVAMPIDSGATLK
jgi:SDR family mycofactocin-dependent oxidoreductase